MAEKLDPTELVTIEDLAISSMGEMAPLIVPMARRERKRPPPETFKLLGLSP